ncbi:MAG: hypothetical protein CML55_09845 [Rhodobacteraceae bacterium]|nr:hypothetical protein [Paracoccaceae bacterium]MBO28768.1 hypothetical protein [Paracoccaceae bacterium]
MAAISCPRALISDNDVTLIFQQSAKPTQDGFTETFNSNLRSECLNAHRSLSLAEAHEKPEGWRRNYDGDRPHRAIRYNVPISIYYQIAQANHHRESAGKNSAFAAQR